MDKRWRENVCGADLTGAVMPSQEALKQKTQTVKFGIPR